MTPATPTPGAGQSWLRRIFNRSTLLAFAAGAALTAGLGAVAMGSAMSAFHHGMMMGGAHSQAEINAHVDHVLKHFYAEIDATDAQKAQIDPIVRQAANEIFSLHPQLESAHEQVKQALLQTPIDRAALETARAQHLQLADQASKRITQLLADVGDVLTPAQRQALAAHLEKMHGK